MAEPGWRMEADGVFRGGGVKGLALAGALQGFAEHPRWPVEMWQNVAGASAGAIIASYLAHDRAPNVGRRMIDLLDPERLASFQDFPFGRRYLGGLPRLLLRHGMATGKAFEKWFDGVMQSSTFDLARPEDGSDDWTRSRLKLIACDVLNRRLLVLPEDLPHYRLPGTKTPIDPATFPISRAVRMSMSLPYFFEPVELELVRGDQGESIPPRRASIVDGGVVSNFPVWLFDHPAPRWPTFGFALEGGSDSSGLRPWPLRFGSDVFHTAQGAWDQRFLSHSTNVRTFSISATLQLPSGELRPVDTTDFTLPKALQDLLVQNGREAATRFLDGFELTRYMNTLHAAPVRG